MPPFQDSWTTIEFAENGGVIASVSDEEWARREASMSEAEKAEIFKQVEDAVRNDNVTQLPSPATVHLNRKIKALVKREPEER